MIPNHIDSLCKLSGSWILYVVAGTTRGPLHLLISCYIRMQVYSGSMFPKQHRGSLFVAEHGSWRLKRKGDIGHRVGPQPY